MPKENKQRGRRVKRKHEDPEVEDSQKRLKINDDFKPVEPSDYTDVHGDPNNRPALSEAQDGFDTNHAAIERPFYGVLDEQEQEYFRKADGMLEANDFQDVEEKTLFLSGVFKETEGKELKLACSQGCSRLLQRLMLLASPTQLKSFFNKFAGQFTHLAQHRFASHCCETLFSQSAQLVHQETLKTTDSDSPSTQDLFLQVVEELQPDLGFLMTDRSASYTIRVLLLVLAGQPLDLARNSVLQSKKKEKIDVFRHDVSNEPVAPPITVPKAFSTALDQLIKLSVTGLDVSQLRALATHPIGNPMLQLLLQLELKTFGKQRAQDDDSIIKGLLPDDPLTTGTGSEAFINGLMYDPIGSRLLESIVEHAPGKVFKSLYKEFFLSRLGSLARNETAGYVVCRILERLSSHDLKDAITAILPQFKSLADRNRTNIIKVLVERSTARNLDFIQLTSAIEAAYADDEDKEFSLSKLLQLSPDVVRPPTEHRLPTPPSSGQAQTSTPASVTHASLLAQAMLLSPGPLSHLVLTSLCALPATVFPHLASSPQHSPLLQTALTSPQTTLIDRRKLTTRLYGSIAQISLTAPGSFVIDALQTATAGGMAFARERVAEELAEAESELRESRWGRKVWRNWSMDLYKRQPREWIRMTRREVGNERFQSFPGGENDDDGEKTGAKHATPASLKNKPLQSRHGHQTGREINKTALQLAREKFARNASAKAARAENAQRLRSAE